MMKSLQHKINLIADLFFGIILMPLLVMFGPVHLWWSLSPFFTATVVAYLYGCYFFLRMIRLPRLLLSRSYRKLGGAAVLLVALTWLLTLVPLPEVDFVIPSMSRYQTSVRDYNIAISVWFMFSVTVGYSICVSFIKELYDRMLMQSELENQRDKAQLALFKAQINPHFLFNTLNSLYSLVIGTSRRAEDAFIKFTELLKYTYMTAGSDRVTVSEEVRYIDNYIDLELLRLGTRTEVDRRCDVDDYATEIPPMIFLTFVENAFKYGASTSRDCRILISLKVNEGVLEFETRNRIMRHSDEFRRTLPVGINNCRKRLEGLYPGRHILDIREEGGEFKVFLKIQLL